MKKNTVILVLSCTLQSIVYAFETPNVIKYSYIGGSVGYGQTALDRPVQAYSFDRNGATWSLFAGFKLLPWLSLEGGYNRMDDVIAEANISGAYVKDTIEPWFAYAALRAELGLSPKIAVFGKLGGAYVEGKDTLIVSGLLTKSSMHKTRPYGALGIDYKLNPNWILQLEATATSKKDIIPRLTIGSIGVRYQFSSSAYA